MTLAVVFAALAVVVLTSIFKVVELSTKAKQALALGVSIVAGAVTAWSTGQFDGVTDVFAVVVMVYGLAQGIYQFVFDKGAVLNNVDRALENFRVGENPEGPPAE